jgi:hypothetical protein
LEDLGYFIYNFFSVKDFKDFLESVGSDPREVDKVINQKFKKFGG